MEKNVAAIPYDKKFLEQQSIIAWFGEFSRVSILRNLKLDVINLGYSKEAIKIADKCNPRLDKTERKVLRRMMQNIFINLNSLIITYFPKTKLNI